MNTLAQLSDQEIDSVLNKKTEKEKLRDRDAFFDHGAY